MNRGVDCDCLDIAYFFNDLEVHDISIQSPPPALPFPDRNQTFPVLWKAIGRIVPVFADKQSDESADLATTDPESGNRVLFSRSGTINA
jgi:hypothetical protein